MRCVFGGVCGVEVIFLILKSITWNEVVKNVIIGLLINSWESGIDKPIFSALLEKVSDTELGTFLRTNVDIQCFHNPTGWLFNTSKQSLLSAATSNGAERFVESCLSSTQQCAL